MLRLWPEAISVGMLPGHCWLRRGKHVTRIDCEPGVPAQLAGLRALLAGEKRRFGRFSRCDAFVSDSHAQIALVPWQANLHTRAQLDAYGRACLDAKGQDCDESWSIHTGFRHFGGMGLAAALPAQLLLQLKELLAESGVALRTAMPITAAAYWHYRPARLKGISAFLFDEPNRLTAAIHENGRLCALDVEPMIGASAPAAARLETRLQLRYPDIRRTETATVEQLPQMPVPVTSTRVWLLAVVGLLATVVATHEYLKAGQTTRQLEREAARLHIPLPTKPRVSKAELELNEQWQRLAVERAFNWYPIFKALEQASADDIELLEFDPDKTNGQLTLRGEARDMQALVAYLGRLSEQRIVARAYLTHQKASNREALKTLTFEIKAAFAFTS